MSDAASSVPSFEQAWHALNAAKNPLLIAHKKPDGDTTGSITAMMNYFQSVGKSCVAFCKDLPTQQFSFLPLVERITDSEQKVLAGQPYDLVIVFDAGDLVYSGSDQLIAKLSSRPMLINIDHHHTNTLYGDLNVVVPNAASTTEVVAHLFESTNTPIDKRVATCLLTGLVTDTGTFSNPATSVSALATASELLRDGAKLSTIIRHVVANRTVEGLKLWGAALERLHTVEPWNIAVTVVTLKDQEEHRVDDDASEGIANFLNSLSGVKGSMVLKELPGGKIKGSFRTSRDDVDMARIAQALGGGGHKKAAGFMIDGRLEQRPDGTWRVV